METAGGLKESIKERKRIEKERMQRLKAAVKESRQVQSTGEESPRRPD